MCLITNLLLLPRLKCYYCCKLITWKDLESRPNVLVSLFIVSAEDSIFQTQTVYISHSVEIGLDYAADLSAFIRTVFKDQFDDIISFKVQTRAL